jgi:hypothetical protein
MRYAVIIGYLAACLVWIYGPIPSDGASGIWWIVPLALLQPAVGVLVGRWWSPLLPLTLIPLSFPGGYGDGEIPIWFAVAFLVAFAVPLIVLGVAARKLGVWYARRTGSRATVAIAAVVVATGCVAVALLLAYGLAESAEFTGNYSASEAARSRDIPVFYAGRNANGYELSAVLRDPSGMGGNDPASIEFIYGTCDRSGEGCAPPIEIANEPACRRNLSLYGPLSSVPHRTRVRGTTAAFFEGGSRLEIQTGTTTVVIFAFSKREVLSVARNLRGLNVPISMSDRLPPPAPGAVEGTLRCGTR